MSAADEMEIQTEMQIETEEQVQSIENQSSEKTNISNNAGFQTISSYEIDQSFQQNIKQARVQQDFLKNIDVFENGKYFYGLTEQMNLKIFSFDEGSSSIQEMLSKQFPQPLYDSIIMKNKNNQDIIAVSIKNQPINVYRVDTNSQTMQDEQTPNKLNLKNIGYLTSQKKNTELYQTPLEFRYDSNKNILLGAGKQFVISYDLNKFAVKETYEKFNKSDILSCFDIPNPNSADYTTYQNVVAYGKFDRKIEILDFKEKKKINSFGIHLGGITCLRFDQQNSNYLYSGARKDDLIYLWDLRKQDTFVHYYSRKCTTNQRMSFDILSNTIAFGHQSGEISFVNTQTKETILERKVHDDCVNSVKLFSKDNKLYCLSTAGQRHYNIGNESESDSNEESSDDEIDIQNKKKQQNIIQEEEEQEIEEVGKSDQQLKEKQNLSNKDKVITHMKKYDNTIKLSFVSN